MKQECSGSRDGGCLTVAVQENLERLPQHSSMGSDNRTTILEKEVERVDEITWKTLGLDKYTLIRKF